MPAAAVRVVSRLREFYRYRDEAEELKPVDLNQIVNQTVELTQPKWKNAGVGRGRDDRIEDGAANRCRLIMGAWPPNYATRSPD